MSLFERYRKNLTKAKLDKTTADRLEHNFMNPSIAFAKIDQVFMKAKFSGMTTDQIVRTIDAGIFKDSDFTSEYLIALKPYLKYWPEDPFFANLVLKSGIKSHEIPSIGVQNINREVIETMIALK